MSTAHVGAKGAMRSLSRFTKRTFACVLLPQLLALGGCSVAGGDEGEREVIGEQTQALQAVAPGTRRNIHDLTSAERSTLASAILAFITQPILDEHRNAHDWHHPSNGELFFIRHHEYLNKLESYLLANGFANFVPFPEWDPATSIPPEFLVLDPLVSQAPLNANPNRPLPSQFNNLCSFSSASALASDLENWHDGVHVAVGGAMGSVPTAPGAPVFWLWHAFIDDIYHTYERCSWPQFVQQTGTALHPTGNDFAFDVAANRDLVAIKKNGTGSGTTEVHILSAASNYQRFSLQTGTALHPTDDTFDFAVAPSNRDIFAIKKSNTAGTTEIHVLSAASGYRSFSLQTRTALHPTDSTWAFAVAQNRDVFAIKKSATGTGSTEVHVLSAASGYQRFSLQTGTALHPTDANWDFGLDRARNLVGIKKNGGSGTTEIHVLSASTNYGRFSRQTPTVLHPTDSTWDFAVWTRPSVIGSRAPQVIGIKKSNTGSGTTEVHALQL